MIEIVIMIAVVGWFASTAKKKNENSIFWGAIGGASYYLPALFFGHVIYPLIIVGWVSTENDLTLKIIGVVLSIIVGAVGVLIAKRILQSSYLSVKSRRIYTFSIITVLIILCAFINFLTLYKVENGISLPGFENKAGIQKLDNGDYVGAITEFTKAINRQPNKSILFYNRGIAYEFSGNYTKAVLDFKKSIWINNFKEKENLCRAFFEIGNCFGRLNQNDSVVFYYIKAHEIKPEDDRIKVEIAFVYSLIGDTIKCRSYLNDVKKIDAEFKDTYDSLRVKFK
jgi:tetratricopeptide (TPR) repeat protein